MKRTKKNALTPRSVKAFREERRNERAATAARIIASVIGSAATVLAVMYYAPK